MPELLEILKESFQKIDERFDKTSQELANFRQEVNRRFDNNEARLNRIESSMVQKTNFNSLVKILENKTVISKYEAAHALHPTATD